MKYHQILDNILNKKEWTMSYHIMKDSMPPQLRESIARDHKVHVSYRNDWIIKEEYMDWCRLFYIERATFSINGTDYKLALDFYKGDNVNVEAKLISLFGGNRTTSRPFRFMLLRAEHNAMKKEAKLFERMCDELDVPDNSLVHATLYAMCFTPIWEEYYFHDRIRKVDCVAGSYKDFLNDLE